MTRNKFNARKVHWCLDCHAATVKAIDRTAKKSGRVRKEYKCSVDPSHKVVCFDSQKEHKRYVELKLLEKSRRIKYLEVHNKVSFFVAGTKITTYTPDFSYFEQGVGEVVEDVKGHMNQTQKELFNIKCNLMKALYGIEVKVI